MRDFRSDKGGSGSILQLISFNIGKDEFCVNLLSVQEVNKTTTITRVPNSPEFIEGVINLRGNVIPVVDLRTKLGLPKVQITSETRIVIVETSNKSVGFLVDEVNEVLRIPENITEPLPPLVTGIKSEYITSVGKLDERLLILLDLDKILEAHDLVGLEQIEA